MGLILLLKERRLAGTRPGFCTNKSSHIGTDRDINVHFGALGTISENCAQNAGF